MNQWQEENRQKLVGIGIVVGIVGAIIAGFVAFTYLGEGASSMAQMGPDVAGTHAQDAYLWIGITVFFILVASCSFIYGFWVAHGINHGKRRLDKDVRILARFGLDSEHNMIDERLLEEDQEEEFKYYVRLLFPTRGRIEYRCHRSVYFQCGEGMTGDAYTEGRWLGRFDPYIGGRIP